VLASTLLRIVVIAVLLTGQRQVTPDVHCHQMTAYLRPISLAFCTTASRFHFFSLSHSGLRAWFGHSASHHPLRVLPPGLADKMPLRIRVMRASTGQRCSSG
ncbi:hypothetical protein N5J28_28985, partial [Klebsiella pneumoniae]